MPNWVAWSGVGATFAFGFVSLAQFVQWLIDRSVRSTERGHVEAILRALGLIRADIVRFRKDPAVKDDPAAQQYLESLESHILPIEDHVETVLETVTEPPSLIRQVQRLLGHAGQSLS